MTFHSSSQGGPPSFERLRPCLSWFLNSCCCGYLVFHLGTFEVQGRQLTLIIWVCETSSLAPPEIEPHEHKRVLYFDDVRRGEINLYAHAFPLFLGHYWFWMSNINEARLTGSKFWFQNTCGKVKSDFWNRFELGFLMLHFFWVTLYFIFSQYLSLTRQSFYFD